MPRPTTKQELLDAAEGQYQKLCQRIDAMTDQQQNAVFDFGEGFNKKEAHWGRDKNLRDVLVHLYEWHQLLLEWVEANQKGEAQPFLPPPYNWKTYGEMNIGFWEKHQNTSLDKAKEMLRESHANAMKMIETFSDEELFTKKYYTWTGSSSLGSYCVSATSSHYDWAIKKLKANKSIS